MTVPYKEPGRNSAGAAIPRDEDGAGGPSTTDRADRLVAGRRRSPIGRWRGLGTRKRTENAPPIKGEASIFNGGSLAVTYTRLRPFTWSLGPSWTTPTIVNIRMNRIASRLN